MWSQVKSKWQAFHDSFHGSDTLVWARAQFLLLAGYTSLQNVDMSAFITDHRLLQLYIFTNGVMTEMLRRRNETDFH